MRGFFFASKLYLKVLVLVVSVLVVAIWIGSSGAGLDVFKNWVNSAVSV